MILFYISLFLIISLSTSCQNSLKSDIDMAGVSLLLENDIPTRSNDPVFYDVVISWEGMREPIQISIPAGEKRSISLPVGKDRNVSVSRRVGDVVDRQTSLFRDISKGSPTILDLGKLSEWVVLQYPLYLIKPSFGDFSVRMSDERLVSTDRSPLWFPKGEPIFIKADLNEGYRLVEWTGLRTNEQPKDGMPYEVVIIMDSEREIGFEVEIKKSSLFVSPLENGSVSPEGEHHDIAFGDSLILEFTPDEGYRISKLIIDGEDHEDKDIWTFYYKEEEQHVDVEFLPKSLSISVEYDTALGVVRDLQSHIISPEDDRHINYGDSDTLYISPKNDSSFIQSVKVNGAEVQLDGENRLILKDISKSKNIEVEFSRKIVHPITVNSHFPLGSDTVTHYVIDGSGFEIIFYRDGFMVDSAEVNHQRIVALDTPYQIGSVDGPYMVSIWYSEFNDAVSYTLTLEGATGGSVNKSPDLPNYPLNSKVFIEAIPDNGYSFDNWTGDGFFSSNSYDSIIITGNLSFTAHFKKNQYELNVNITNGTYTIVPKKQFYLHGETVTITAPSNDAGFTFNGWSGDASGSGESVEITVTNNMNVTASYRDPNQVVPGGMVLIPAGGITAILQ